MIANTPEKPHFDRIYALAKQSKENGEDIKELKKAAKKDGTDVKVLMKAVALALEDDDKKRARREIEGKAEALLQALGPFIDSPLGGAAIRAAQ